MQWAIQKGWRKKGYKHLAKSVRNLVLTHSSLSCTIRENCLWKHMDTLVVLSYVNMVTIMDSATWCSFWSPSLYRSKHFHLTIWFISGHSPPVQSRAAPPGCVFTDSSIYFSYTSIRQSYEHCHREQLQ